MTTPYRSLRRLAPFALLLGLAACSSEVVATIDAGTVIGDAPRSDLPSTTDIPPTDVSSVDIPSTDVSSTDVSSVDIPSTDVSSTDVSRADVPLSDACRRPDIQTLPTRIDCSPRSDGGTCPLGYACLSLSGVVLQQFCGRACAADCDCPTTERCGSYTDKAGMHSLCVTANPGG
jgi:hypothetical protein